MGFFNELLKATGQYSMDETDYECLDIRLSDNYHTDELCDALFYKSCELLNLLPSNDFSGIVFNKGKSLFVCSDGVNLIQFKWNDDNKYLLSVLGNKSRNLADKLKSYIELDVPDSIVPKKASYKVFNSLEFSEPIFTRIKDELHSNIENLKGEYLAYLEISDADAKKIFYNKDPHEVQRIVFNKACENKYSENAEEEEEEEEVPQILIGNKNNAEELLAKWNDVFLRDLDEIFDFDTFSFDFLRPKPGVSVAHFQDRNCQILSNCTESLFEDGSGLYNIEYLKGNLRLIIYYQIADTIAVLSLSFLKGDSVISAFQIGTTDTSYTMNDILMYMREELGINVPIEFFDNAVVFQAALVALGRQYFQHKQKQQKSDFDNF